MTFITHLKATGGGTGLFSLTTLKRFSRLSGVRREVSRNLCPLPSNSSCMSSTEVVAIMTPACTGFQFSLPLIFKELKSVTTDQIKKFIMLAEVQNANEIRDENEHAQTNMHS